MVINTPSIGSNPIQDNPEMIIGFLPERPQLGNFFAPAQTPSKMVGYYDPVTDRVELYVVDARGTKYLRVG